MRKTDGVVGSYVYALSVRSAVGVVGVRGSTLRVNVLVFTDAAMNFRFEVKFYPEDPSTLSDDVARSIVSAFLVICSFRHHHHHQNHALCFFSINFIM